MSKFSVSLPGSGQLSPDQYSFYDCPIFALGYYLCIIMDILFKIYINIGPSISVYHEKSMAAVLYL